MRGLLGTIILTSIMWYAYADYSGFSNPPPNPPNVPNSSNPQTPGQPGTGDTYGSMVQQQTSQALQTFQNVNYQKLSGNENMQDFFSDDNSTYSQPDSSHLFNVFSGS